MYKQSVSNGCKVIVLLLLCLTMHTAYGGVVDNTVYTERNERISSGNDLISSILNNCYDMNCLKGNVLNYLNTFLGIDEQVAARSTQNVDEQIYERVARLLKTNEFKFELPETFFRKSIVSFNGERGFDVKVSEDAVVEGLFCFVLFFFSPNGNCCICAVYFPTFWYILIMEISNFNLNSS